MIAACSDFADVQDRLSREIYKIGPKIVSRRTGYSLDTVLNWAKRKSWPGMRAWLVMVRELEEYGFEEAVCGEWLARKQVTLDVRIKRMQSDLSAIIKDTKHAYPSLAGSIAGASAAAVRRVDKVAKQTTAALIVGLGLAAGLSGIAQQNDVVRAPTARVQTARVREMV